MRKTPLILVLFLMVMGWSSCVSHEDKAKKAIKTHLSKSMHDFDSYSPVEYGKIDSFYSQYDNQATYLDLKSRLKTKKDSMLLIDKVGRDLMAEMRINRLRFESYGASQLYRDQSSDLQKMVASMNQLSVEVKVLTDSLTDFINNFHPSHVGWGMSHSFRGKNANGATVLTSKYYVLNMNRDTVIAEINTDK
jgi:hypothetical protein